MYAKVAAGNRSTLSSRIVVRPFTDDDEAATIEVLAASLGGGPAGRRTSDFFRWKHVLNPFGRSFILVAEADERIVGVRALMRWRFEAGDRVVRAVRAVDTATHPEWQGRGLFTRLTLEAVNQVRRDTDLIFNTPNEKSLPGYLEMGWRVVQKLPVAVRVRRPVRFARGFRKLNGSATPKALRPPLEGPTAAGALESPGITELLADLPRRRELATARDLSYLRWRYGAAPLLDYRAVVEREGTAVTGLAIFRVRSRGTLWESTVCELIVRPGDAGTCRRLLRQVASSANVDHVTCHFPPHSLQFTTARRAGFLPSPGGVTFVVNSLSESLPIDPKAPGSWGLSLGDVEVF